LILVQVLGAAMMTTFTKNPNFAARYATDSIGGLLGAGLEPAGGFGQFCLVVLAFGIVANNIPNMYSLALTTQALHPWLQAIPRPFVVVLGTIVSVVLAIVGYNHFQSWLDTMLVLLSYWLAIYSVIVIEEHLIFRGGKWSNYDPDTIHDLRILPIGIAAFLALGAGGAVLLFYHTMCQRLIVVIFFLFHHVTSCGICPRNGANLVYRHTRQKDRAFIRRRYWI
jgi:purine-cytosine permease-like protein